MKKCAIISCYIVNEYRRKLVQALVDTFHQNGLDVILVSSDHIPKLNNIKNYITCTNVCRKNYTNGHGFTSIQMGDKVLSFWEGHAPNSYQNYFIKMYQSVFSYVKHLGYEYMYFIDQDMVMNSNTISEILNPTLDLSKVHFYKWINWYSSTDAEEYQVTFFHGNINVLTSIFLEENLEKLESFAKTAPISVEGSVYFLTKDNPAISSFVIDPYVLFDKVNLFSSANAPKIYFDNSKKTYMFLHMKGDISRDSITSAELYEEDILIYQNSISNAGVWHSMFLEPNKKYTIKQYDKEISEETLYTTRQIYTDINNPTTLNYITS